MKASLFFGLLSLSFLAHGLASAEEFRCTTENRPGSACHNCELDRSVGSGNSVNANGSAIRCDNSLLGHDNIFWLTDCIGNEDGRMVHGAGAPDSCNGFALEDDILHGICRAANGARRYSNINIADYFGVSSDNLWGYCIR